MTVRTECEADGIPANQIGIVDRDRRFAFEDASGRGFAAGFAAGGTRARRAQLASAHRPYRVVLPDEGHPVAIDLDPLRNHTVTVGALRRLG